MNLRWNACSGDAGVSNRVSACATNTGTNPLVGSFVPAADVVQANGVQIYIVSWERSPLDDAAFPGTLCCYQIESHPGATPGAPWSNLVGVPATHSASVQLDFPTTADATASDPALFEYRVVATAADTALWVSNVVAGYSVDNLAPPDPASVSGSIASGFATLFRPV